MKVRITWNLRVTQVIDDAKSVESAAKRSKKEVVAPIRLQLGSKAVQIPGFEAYKEAEQDKPPEKEDFEKPGE